MSPFEMDFLAVPLGFQGASIVTLPGSKTKRWSAGWRSETDGTDKWNPSFFSQAATLRSEVMLFLFNVFFPMYPMEPRGMSVQVAVLFGVPLTPTEAFKGFNCIYSRLV